MRLDTNVVSNGKLLDYASAEPHERVLLFPEQYGMDVDGRPTVTELFQMGKARILRTISAFSARYREGFLHVDATPKASRADFPTLRIETDTCPCDDPYVRDRISMQSLEDTRALFELLKILNPKVFSYFVPLNGEDFLMRTSPRTVLRQVNLKPASLDPMEWRPYAHIRTMDDMQEGNVLNEGALPDSTSELVTFTTLDQKIWHLRRAMQDPQPRGGRAQKKTRHAA